jgi:membrane protease subunit (stomatin/prohibitin family)
MLACQRQIPEAVRTGRQATGGVRVTHFGLALHMTAASTMSEEGQKRQGNCDQTPVYVRNTSKADRIR